MNINHFRKVGRKFCLMETGESVILDYEINLMPAKQHGNPTGPKYVIQDSRSRALTVLFHSRDDLYFADFGGAFFIVCIPDDRHVLLMEDYVDKLTGRQRLYRHEYDHEIAGALRVFDKVKSE